LFRIGIYADNELIWEIEKVMYVSSDVALEKVIKILTANSIIQGGNEISFIA